MAKKRSISSVKSVFDSLKSKSTYDSQSALTGSTGISQEELASSAFQSGLGANISEQMIKTNQEVILEDNYNKEISANIKKQQQEFVDTKAKEVAKLQTEQANIKKALEDIDVKDPNSKEINSLLNDPKNYVKIVNPLIPTSTSALGVSNIDASLKGDLTPAAKQKLATLKAEQQKVKAPLMLNLQALKEENLKNTAAIKQTEGYLAKIKRIEDLEGKQSVYGKNINTAFSEYDQKIEDKYGTGVVGKVAGWLGGATKSVNSFFYNASQTISPPEKGMNKKEKEEYLNLKNQIRTIEKPFIEKTVEDFKALEEESKKIYQTEQSFSGSEIEDHKIYSLMALGRAIEEGENYLQDKGGASIFFNELSKITIGRNGLMEDAQRSLNEFWRYDNLVKKEAEVGYDKLSPVEQQALKVFSRAQELENALADKQSFGYKTVKGTMGSVGFIRNMWIGNRAAQFVGAVTGTTRAAMGANTAKKIMKLTENAKLARVAGGAVKTASWLGEQAAVTYIDPKSINARKNKGSELTTDAEGKVLDFNTREELYNLKKVGNSKEAIRLTGIKKMLESQGNLSEEDQLALQSVKARLGEEEVEGIVSLQDELKMYETESDLKANLKGIGDTAIESLSELYTGKLLQGIGAGVKMLPRAKGIITKIDDAAFRATSRIYNTGVGRAYKNWQNLVGKVNISDTKVVGSVFEEQLEEYTAAIGHSLFDWDSADVEQTFSAEGSQDIAAQTLLMNGMFGVGGNVQMHTKLAYNNLYTKRLQKMNKRVAELEDFVKNNPEDADGKKALNEYRTQLESVKTKSSLGVLDPMSIISRDKTGFSTTKNFIDNRKSVRKTIDTLRYASNDEDINTAIDVASLSMLGAADKNYEAQVLRSKGKVKEAELIEKSMFKDILFKSFQTQTEDELEDGLKRTLANKNLSADKKVQLTKLYDVVTQLKDVKKKYEGNKNADKAVTLTYEILSGKQELQEARENLLKNSGPVKESIDAFIRSRGLTGIQYTPETLLSQEFSDPAEQAKYDDFIDQLYTFEDEKVKGQLNGLRLVESLEEHISDATIAKTEVLHPSPEVKNGQAMLEEISNEAKKLFTDKENPLKLQSAVYDSEGELIQSKELVAELYDAMKDKWVGSFLEGKISQATFSRLKNAAIRAQESTEEIKKFLAGKKTTEVIANAEEAKSNLVTPPITNMPTPDFNNLPLTDGVAQQNFDDIVQTSPIFNMSMPEPVFPDQGAPVAFSFNISGNISPNQDQNNQDEVARLRAEEQVKKAEIEKIRTAELENNAQAFDSSKAFDFANEQTNARYDAKQEELYKEYDKLISPLLKKTSLQENQKQQDLSLIEQAISLIGTDTDNSKEVNQFIASSMTEFGIKGGVSAEVLPKIKDAIIEKYKKLESSQKSTPESTGDAFIVSQDDFEDFMLGPQMNYSIEDQKLLIDFVTNLASPIAMITGQDVSLTMAFEQFFRSTDRKEDAVKRMAHFINGWKLAGFKTEDNEILNLANKFGNLTQRAELEQNFFDRFGDTIPNIFTSPLGATSSIGLDATIESSEKVNTELQKKEEPTFYEENASNELVTPGIEDVKEGKINSVKPKVGFSAMAHENVTLENGVVVKRTVGDFLNIIKGHPLGLDFRPLLHPDNGPTITLKIQEVEESKWNQVPVPAGLDERGMPILDDKGQTKLISFAQWVSENKGKPNFEEAFSNKVPYLFTHNGTPVGYVHETDWYNPNNVSHPHVENMKVEEMDAEWAAHIQAGKDATAALRNNIANGLTEVTATIPVNAIYHTLDENEELITIKQSNPQAVMAVQIGVEGVLEGLDKGFETGEKVLLNSKDGADALNANTSGHTWAVHRVGTQINPTTGKKFETYRAVKVNRFFTETQMDSIQWAIAAHRILNAQSVPSQFNMSSEQAETIRKDLRKSMGLNLKDTTDLANYIQHFIKIKKGALADWNSKRTNYTAKDVTDKLAYMSILFEQNNTFEQLLELVEQNTSKRGLKAKTPVAIVSRTGVTDYKNSEGKVATYQEYLAETVYTNIKTFDMDSTGTKPTFALGIQPIISLDYVPVEGPLVKNSVQESIQEAAQQVIAEQLEAPEEVFDVKAAEDYLNSLGINLEDFELEDMHIGDMSKISNLFQVTPGLIVAEERPLKEEIAHEIITRLNFRGKVSEETKEKIKREIKELITKKLNGTLKTLSALQEKASKEKEPSNKVQTISKALSVTIENVQNVIENFEIIYDKAIAEVNLQTKIDLTSKDYSDEDDQTLSEKNYSKDSIEESLKTKASERLRMLLSGIPQYDSKGEVVKGYLGFRRFMSLNDVYNQVLKNISFGIDPDSNFDNLVAKLSESNSPAMVEVVKRLLEGDSQIQNEFTYNVVAHTLSSKFAMFEELEKGFSLQMYDTNANEITRVLKNIWKENSVASDLYNYDGSINEGYATALLQEFESFPADVNQVPEKVLRDWLSKLGLELNDKTWEDIYQGKLYYQGKFQTFNKLYTQGKGGLYKELATFLRDAIKTPAEYAADGKYNILSNLSGLSNAIASVEAKYNPQLVSLSFRDTGKNISTQVPPKFITDKVAELLKDARGTQDKIKELQNISYSQDSLILDLLTRVPEMQESFKIHHTSITALKEKGAKVFGKNDITSLGELSYDLVTTTGFSDRRVAKLPEHEKINGFSLRMANMLFPTMSDKSTGLFLTAPVFDFMKDADDAFELDTEGKIKNISEDTKDVLFNYLVLPEIKRMHNYYKNVKATNIKGYDKAVGMFHLFPVMNTLTNTDGVLLKDIIMNNAEVGELDVILEEYGDIFKNAIQGVIKKEVDYKVSQWGEAKEEVDGKMVSKMFGTEYFEGKDPEKYYETAVWDYVMNSMLFNAEIFKVFAGDIAVYSQDKLFKKEITDPKEYISINKQIGINLGKRLALLIAPGKKIANSVGEKYNQVILKDSVDIAENAEFLIEMYYSREDADKAAPLLKKYSNISRNLDRLQKVSLVNKSSEQVDRYYQMQAVLEKELKGIRETLSDNYRSLEAYFDIESTDAQEYTTVTEHINILQRLGRITPEDEKAILNSLFENKDLTKEQLSLVMQPIKPVHTGNYVNTELDVNRIIYVKSSAFPLIPQLTKATKLDNLRNALEKLEGVTGRFTRASYQTANKVGSVVDENAINPLDVNDLEKLYTGLNSQTKEFDSKNIGVSVLVLDRNNFRIQQDVPFKSDKKKRDEVAMGTQIFKLLFGDGVKQGTTFNFKGLEKTGEELYEIYNSSFAKIVDAKKKELFRDLGLDPQGKIIDEKMFVTSLQEVLEKEAIDRGYSIKSIRGLKMDSLISAATGATYFEFKTPLWLSPDSNRYESLLNSIITNRIMKHKMPGSGYVAGSEHGFQFKEDLSELNENRTIFFDGWNGKELQGVHTVTEDGEVVFQKAQVLAPSKFKDSKGKLINLFEGYNEKTKDVSKAKYLKRNENGSLGLKEELLDKELLNLFSFRTPTSSHVSGSSIEIVGILPPESGDLMLVPKNFTKQKGLDYDIDKESGYQLNHVVNKETGAIEVLSQEHLAQELDVFEKKIEEINLENTILELKGRNIEIEGKENKYAKPSIFDMKNSLLERFAAILEDSVSQEDIEILLDPTTSIREKKEAKKIQLEKKLAENDFIRVHLAVYNSPDMEIQKKINKVLSMSFAQDQAKTMEKLSEEGTKVSFINSFLEKNPDNSPADAEEAYQQDIKNSTILGYSYQKAKMSLGSIGKTAIGIYANYTTFNGLIQQSFGEDGMTIINPKTEGRKEMTIGHFTSSNLGAKQTLSPMDPIIAKKWLENKYQRDSSEVWAEKENTATDNEKEQILGRVGVDEDTINAEAVATLRNFDKDENGNSIPYLLLSQPVIKDYVSQSKNVKGLLGKYISKEDMINQIIAELSDNTIKYEVHPETFEYEFMELDGTPIFWEGSKDLTGDNLVKGIKENGKDKKIQLDAFMTFIELQKEGGVVASIQKVVNTNTLGKSIIEGMSRYESLAALSSNKMVPEAIKLLGEICTDCTDSSTGFFPFSYTSETKKGPILKTVWIKPSTPQGQIVINGLYIGNNLFKDFFPYKEKAIKTIFNEIGLSENESTRIEEAEMIIEEIKKYFYSNPNLGIFEGGIDAKRQELFVDDSSNTSMAKYLMTTLKSQDKDYRKGLKTIKNNPLLQRFIFEVGKSKEKVSVIKYNNSATDNLDEESLYNSLPELIEANFPLPPKNGKPYSTTQLAMDLVGYSFLEGGIQEATQFVKFVPIELLEAAGRLGKKGNFLSIATNLKAYNPKRNTNLDLFEGFLGIKEESVGGVSTFTKQFFQHFPQKAKKINFKDRKNLANNGTTFTLSKEEYPVAPKFTQVKGKAGNVRLYMHVGENAYQEVEVLSGKGISQYQYKVESAVGIKQTPLAPLTPNLVQKAHTAGNLIITPSMTIKDVVKNISELKLSDKYAHLTQLASWMKNMAKDTGDLHIIDETKMAGLGATGAEKLYIKLNASLFGENKGPELASEIFMHEFIHHVSIKELGKYYNENYTALKEGSIPSHVQTLDTVFNLFTSSLDESKLKKFRELQTIINNTNLSKEERKAALMEREAYEERDLYYTALNIKEFVAMSLTDVSIQKKLSEMPYLKSGKTFLEKLQDILVELFSATFPAIKENSLAMGALKASMNFIQEEYNIRTKNSLSLPQVNEDPIMPDSLVFNQLAPEPDFFPSMPEPTAFPTFDTSGKITSLPGVSVSLNINTPKERTITYAPTGKARQTYRVEVAVWGEQIFNSKGVEVFKTEGVDRNRILANLAVKEKRAVIVEHKIKGEDVKFVMLENNQILSVTTGKIMKWAESNGDRQAITAKANKLRLEQEDNALPLALPLGISQMEWESLTPAEQQKIKDCN